MQFVVTMRHIDLADNLPVGGRVSVSIDNSQGIFLVTVAGGQHVHESQLFRGRFHRIFPRAATTKFSGELASTLISTLQFTDIAKLAPSRVVKGPGAWGNDGNFMSTEISCGGPIVWTLLTRGPIISGTTNASINVEIWSR